jgi:RNA polymerase sigma-70 factor (ECF subfamily)
MDEMTTELDDQMQLVDTRDVNPEALLVAAARSELVQRALEKLPAEFREAVILRELEGMSYKEIAEIAGIPVGTVMSRLARARARLQIILSEANPSGVRA